jgi:hypothetical protein
MSMKMCEFANNITNMGFLFRATNIHHDIIYKGKPLFPTLLYVVVQTGSFDKSFPIVYRGRNYTLLENDYIILHQGGTKIEFEKTYAVFLVYHIYYE